VIFAALVTILGALLIVALLAIYLIQVASLLWRVDRKLGAILTRIASINQKAEPVGLVISQINEDLSGADSALRDVLSKQRPPRRRQLQRDQTQPARPDPARPGWVVAPGASTIPAQASSPPGQIRQKPSPTSGPPKWNR
jgi:hypothetical protein